MVAQIDWLASLAALLERPIPKGSAPDSFNRLSNWLGTDFTDRPWVVQQAYDNSLALRTPHWKYIMPSGSPAVVPWGTDIETGCQPSQQLYDMTKPYEAINVAAEYPDELAILFHILQNVRNSNYNLLSPSEMP